MNQYEEPFRRRSLVLELFRRGIHGVRKVLIKIKLREKCRWGKEFWIGRNWDLRSPDHCEFGDRVSIGKNFTLETNLHVGNDVLISSNVSVVGNDHRFADRAKTVFTEGRNPPATVVLDGDNLIGFGVIIVGGVNIGRGCIVGAGSVVVRDLPEYSVCVGVPARPIRERFSGVGL